jgi:DNA mismatch endonuclease (patch repair protein)
MDKISKKTRSYIMRRIKSSETSLEVDFFKLLSKKGLKFKKNSINHFGKPDIVFHSKKFVIFLDSCFWHGCKYHLRMPSSNRKYWRDKIYKNMRRDAEVKKYYKSKGWIALRIWEHQLKKKSGRWADRIFSLAHRL